MSMTTVYRENDGRTHARFSKKHGPVGDGYYLIYTDENWRRIDDGPAEYLGGGGVGANTSISDRAMKRMPLTESKELFHDCLTW